MVEQLGLNYGEQHRLATAWEEVLPLLNKLVTDRTIKEFAFVVGASDTSVAHAMAERAKHHWQARWLVYAVQTDRTKALIRTLCRLADGAFQEKEPLTPEEEVRRWRALAARNPTIAAAARDEVYGDGARR